VIRRSGNRDSAIATIKETPSVNSHAAANSTSTTARRARGALAFAAIVTAAVGVLFAPAAASATSPALRISVTSHPTHFVPNSSGTTDGNVPEYAVAITNIGSERVTEPITVVDTLPPGITQSGTGLQTVTLTNSNFFIGESGDHHIDPGEIVSAMIPVDVGDLEEGSTVTNSVTLTGGGSPDTGATTTTTISSELAKFDFVSEAQGLELTDLEGLPVTGAGSHLGQFTLDVGFPTMQIGTGGGFGVLNGVDGGVRDVHAVLPRGLIVNPSAAPVRCTEAQLESHDNNAFEITKCPLASQVGLVSVVFTPTSDQYVETFGWSALYRMVTPRGVPAQLGFNAANVNIYVHFDGGVHPGDYSITANSDDILARFSDPIVRVQTVLWGDPSSPTYDHMRGPCAIETFQGSCAVAPQSIPFVSMPTACKASLDATLFADSWLDPGVFHTTSFPATDIDRNPTGVDGCSALNYNEPSTEPTLKARPTTSVADAPSGLEVDLHIPQQKQDLNTLSEPHLKDATVTLPEGMSLNPSSANGLDGCSSAQIGIDPATGKANGDPPSCPDASKLGTLEVDTPLLENPLPGAIYLAKPHDNPFDSLFAIYLAVDDPQTGLVIKLAGHVSLDSNTGRLTTTFEENPELPFEDFKLDFFGGAGGPIRTPAVCGQYSTTSELTPWSGTPPAHPHDDYSISQAPGGGTCPTSPGSEPNSPSFDAGTVSPIAGAYSPLVFNLRRADGSQTFSSLSVRTPPGLTGKLAGIASCPDSALAAAAAKPGRQEQASPSCPASSRVGTVDVAAGAGPAPFHTQGTVYLTGPYKGAPLGLAIITPAVAGPFDLGTVVVRTALHVDQNTSQITADSDEIPHILQGIPLDVRSIALQLDRSKFTRNGTSCDPFSISGLEVSTLGQRAPLAEHFQLGECRALSFKPKLSISLFGGTKRGGHPALRGVVQMPEGGANLAKAVVALPHSEFLDQAHIGTVCTRVQFAEGAGNGEKCPAASIYGQAVVTSPLVDYAFEGPAILRSSSHELPDLVLALHGPPSQPIAVNAVGRVDSVKGGIRTTFDDTPDVPVSKVVLSMQGGAKGLLQNSTNTCKGTHKATVELDGQNGKTADLSPALLNGKCAKPKRHRKRHPHAARHSRAAG
jgi:hypothetical protein